MTTWVSEPAVANLVGWPACGAWKWFRWLIFCIFCLYLKVNGENWVPVVVGDLRDDALHDGNWQAPFGASEILPKCEVATIRSLSSANTDFFSKIPACYDKILNENLHPYINILHSLTFTWLVSVETSSLFLTSLCFTGNNQGHISSLCVKSQLSGIPSSDS